MPVDKVQKIFTQLVGAVSYVHNLSCVHRDLKLENILLDKNENVKLCDFGFTREYEGKSNHLQTFCGTICYSAPEMLKGEKYAGEKVDVWSLGVILYALLCGELPFDDDDDNVTRTKILSSEPKWPDHMPADAKSLIAGLLSKRPLLRPSLADTLAHSFLAEYAPQQQAILKLQQPAPFSTILEKETLERMRSAGVNIDQVIENVLARRCDALAGWWALLIEKEQRKAARRERKRKEREAEVRASRRLSGASSRRTSTLQGVDEEGTFGDSASHRGRKERRSAHYPELVFSDLPNLPEHTQFSPGLSSDAPPPVEKDSLRSASSSAHRRPIPPPKEGLVRSARSRGSTLQLVTSNPDLLHSNGVVKRPPRRQHAFINHLAHWKHWFLSTTKRTRSPNKKASHSAPNLTSKMDQSSGKILNDPNFKPTASKGSNLRPQIITSMSESRAPSFLMANTPDKRNSLSPAPMTPRSTFRRQHSGLRGRKSTSSSVSSIRSIHHHHHSHSKASSTSSNTSDATSKTPMPSRSPHHSVKVLPATPTAGAFPSNIRLVRQTPISNFNESVKWPREISPGGLVFAKRKRNVFKGPILNFSPGNGSPVGPSDERTKGTHSRSTSLTGHRSEEPIQEEDEDEEIIEEVDHFGPVKEDETEERIYGGEGEGALDPEDKAEGEIEVGSGGIDDDAATLETVIHEKIEQIEL